VALDDDTYSHALGIFGNLSMPYFALEEAS